MARQAITKIQPDGLVKRMAGGHVLYHHVVVVEPGTLVMLSGQLARDRDGNVVGKGDMGAQIRQVCENIKVGLAAGGARLEDVIKTNTYVTDIEAYFKHVAVRLEYFGQVLPTSTTVEVRRLAHPDFMVEIEAIARLPG
jgi:enamine deaminase RidA (YjgF/YER057c/UK114 family)